MKIDPANASHRKSLLSGSDNFSIVYCHTCRTLELNWGALTLRIEPESLNHLSSMLSQAKSRLERLESKSAEIDTQPPRDNSLIH